MKIDNEDEVFTENLLSVCEKHHGAVPVVLYYSQSKAKKMAPEKYCVNLSDEMYTELKNILPEENIKLMTKER